MALSAENLARPGNPCAAGRVQPGANDAHSFWKPPESWRGVPGVSINASAAEAERFLYEKYLSEDERRPLQIQVLPGRVRSERSRRGHRDGAGR